MGAHQVMRLLGRSATCMTCSQPDRNRPQSGRHPTMPPCVTTTSSSDAILYYCRTGNLKRSAQSLGSSTIIRLTSWGRSVLLLAWELAVPRTLSTVESGAYLSPNGQSPHRECGTAGKEGLRADQDNRHTESSRTENLTLGSQHLLRHG